jgi:formylglycine-generating enzyme required for sulfatase activity
MNALRFTRFAAALVFALSVTAAHAQAIDWVTVGDPGNAADTTGDPNPAGAVAASFRIMKYEWTNSQYVDFLNAVDPNGTNPNSIYNASMGSDARGGISFTSGTTAGAKYASKTDMAAKPVNYVSWFDAARVSNWLMNGATSSSSTETGAYTLNNVTSGTAPAVNPGATFYIPTEDQWYKAAYYKGSGTNAGYWEYATQVTGTAPTAVTADSTGIGSAGSAGNFANYDTAADWNGQDGNVTTVGTNGGPSAYGAFDMSGNVWEWNDLTGAAGSSRGIRGGSGFGDASDLSSTYRSTSDLSNERPSLGFRLASPLSGPSGVPEIDPAGVGSVLALVTGALGLLERRRMKAKVA